MVSCWSDNGVVNYFCEALTGSIISEGWTAPVQETVTSSQWIMYGGDLWNGL